MFQNLPLVSICIPAYNDPILFRRCLDSILCQDYPNIEIIISDDSSNDDIKAILSNISTRFPLKYSLNKPPLKSPVNWNNSLDHASGDLVLLMHHDDLFTYHNSVQSFVKEFEKDEKIDVVFSTPQTLDESGRSLQLGYSSASFYKMIQKPHRLFVSNILGAPSNMMFKKNSFRYRVDLVWMVDMEYYYRNILSGLEIIYTPESLVTTGVHRNQTTEFCIKHPDIALREHTLICATIPEHRFFDIFLFDHFWRQLRNNGIRSIHDPIFRGNKVPPIMMHMIAFLTMLPVKLTFNGLLSKMFMLVSYVIWYFRSKI